MAKSVMKLVPTGDIGQQQSLKVFLHKQTCLVSFPGSLILAFSQVLKEQGEAGNKAKSCHCQYHCKWQSQFMEYLCSTLCLTTVSLQARICETSRARDIHLSNRMYPFCNLHRVCKVCVYVCNTDSTILSSFLSSPNTLHYILVNPPYYSILQYISPYYSILQYISPYYSILQYTTVHLTILQYTTVYHSTSHHTTVRTPQYNLAILQYTCQYTTVHTCWPYPRA